MSKQDEGPPPEAEGTLRPQVRAAGIEAIKKGGGNLVLLGILSVVLGIFCILAPNLIGWTSTLLFGLLLIVFGGLQVVAGIDMEEGTKGRGWTMIGGILAVVVGMFFVVRPFQGLAMLTWMIAIFLLLEGGLRIAGSFELKPAQGWGLFLFSGIASVILGILLIADWPSSALWFLGTVIGIHFLLAGTARLVLGMAARKAANQAAAGG